MPTRQFLSTLHHADPGLEDDLAGELTESTDTLADPMAAVAPEPEGVETPRAHDDETAEPTRESVGLLDTSVFIARES